MEWGAVVMWAAIGSVSVAALLVAAVVGLAGQLRTARPDPDDAHRSTDR